MPTVTKTVRSSGGDYTDIQSALDYFINRDFTADGDYSEIVIYPEGGGTDNEWVLSANLDGPTGTTTSATRYLLIRGSAGFSFGDSDALKYDPSKGVAIRQNYNWENILIDLPDYTRVEDLQFCNLTTNGGGLHFTTSGLNNHLRFDRLIIKVNGNYGISHQQLSYVLTVVNSLVYINNAAPTIAHGYSSSDNYIASTSYTSGSDDYPQMCRLGGGNDIISVLCANPGTETAFYSSASYSGSSGYCGSDDTTGPTTGKVSSLTPADVFESVTWGSEDFRIKSTATSVLTAGYTASSYTGDVDIRGTARGANPTIGCWEYPSAAAQPIPPPLVHSFAVTRSNTY